MILKKVSWMFGTGILGAMMVTGCGRSVHSTPPATAGAVVSVEPSHSPMPEISQAPESPVVNRVEATWESEDGIPHKAGKEWATEDGVHYVSKAPISLSASITGKVDFKMNLPKRFSGTSTVFRADLLGQDNVPAGATIEESIRSSNSFQFQVSGILRALKSAVAGHAGEKTVVLQIVGADPSTGEIQFEGRINLMTPPAQIGVVQETVDAFQKHGFPASVQTSLLYGSDSVELLQVLSFHNPTDLTIELVLPQRPTGRLVARFEDVGVDQQQCGYSTHSSQREEELSHSFWVIPFGSSNTQEGEGGVHLSIGAGETAFAGIYSSGAAVQQLIEGNYPQPAFQKTNVVASCRSVPMFPIGSRTIYVGSQVDAGTRALPITLELDSEHLNGSLSFSGTNDDGAPESTDFPVLTRESVQRE